MIFSGLKKISFILDRKSKIKFFILIILLLLRSLLEGFGLGLIAPFLAAIGKPSLIFENDFFIYINNFLKISTTEELILFASLSLVSYFLVKNLFIFFTTYFQAKLIFSDRAIQSHKLFKYYMRAPYAFHLKHHSAELDRNIRYEIPKVYQFIEASLLVFTNIILILSIFILLTFVNWQAVIGITSIIGLVALLILFLSNRSSKKYGEELIHSQFRLGQSLKEGLSTIVESKLSNIEHFFPKKYLDHYLVTARSQWRQMTINSAPILIFETVAVCLLVSFVILLAVEGEVLLELLPLIGLFAFAFIRLLPASNMIVKNLNSIEFVYPAVRVIHEEFEQFAKISEKNNIEPKNLNFSSLEFKNVSFSYESTDIKILDDICFNLNKSETIAFIGTSGSGKTTLLNLLVGLLDPSQGSIEVNGEDLKENLFDFRSIIGYVPQNINLVDASVKENISLGVEPNKIDSLRIEKVMKEACLDGFVATLSEKEDTIIGEDGVRLSGGQRQRLGIARALYHNPKILIFDEATSSLDSNTEITITDEIMSLSGDRTMIFISHRINTIKDCDKIYSLENGSLRLIDNIHNFTQ